VKNDALKRYDGMLAVARKYPVNKASTINCASGKAHDEI